jgi:isopenicillin N synthase-like dioxygenase
MPVAVEAQTLSTLDLRSFDGHASERSRFLEELRTAARSVGFFYLVGHGIEDSLIHDVLKVSRRFFALPEKDKFAIEMVYSPHFQRLQPGRFRTYPRQARLARAGRHRAGKAGAALRPRHPPHGRACRARTNGSLRSQSSSLPFSPIRMRPLRLR